MDWNNLLNDLSRAGYSQNRIAGEMGKAQSWVADICKGRYADLKWSDGERLIRLHKRVMRKQRQAAPQISA